MFDFRKEFVNETILNLFTKEEKELYIDEIWNNLYNSYKDIGGIKGEGFANKNDMIRNIKHIKISKKDSIIVAGILYKDKGFRKSVAVFTDGTNNGEKALLSMLKDDFSRSLIEISHTLLKFLERNAPTLLAKYSIESSKVSKLINKDIEIISKYKYKRKVGGEFITKMLVGSIDSKYLDK